MDQHTILDTMLRITADASAVCWIFNLYCSFHRPRNTTAALEKAKKSNHMIVLPWEKEARADVFRGGGSNSWGVFTGTDRGTIAVFDHSGTPLYELCIPVSFRQFSVNDEAVTVASGAENVFSFPFSEATYCWEDIPLSVPPKAEQPIAKLQMSNGKLYAVNAAGKTKRFRYFGILPEIVYERLHLVCCMLLILTAILMRIKISSN